MEINTTYAIEYLDRLCAEKEITEDLRDELAEFVQIYSIYLAQVRAEVSKDVLAGFSVGSFSVELAHETVVNQLIKDRRKA